VNVATAQQAPFEIVELVEAEQRVMAGLAEMAVVGRAFLAAVRRALRAVHVENDHLRRLARVHSIDSIACQIAERREVASYVNNAVSKRPI
jgi:hypothetical protein